MLGRNLAPSRLAALALFALLVLALVGQSSNAEATVSVPPVFRALRVVFRYNGVPGSVQAPLYGGAGMTITDNGVSFGTDFIVTFPAGTWINPRTNKPCHFVPTVRAIGQPNATAAIYRLTENTDGSGSMGVITGSGLLTSIIAVSADC